MWKTVRTRALIAGVMVAALILGACSGGPGGESLDVAGSDSTALDRGLRPQAQPTPAAAPTGIPMPEAMAMRAAPTGPRGAAGAAGPAGVSRAMAFQIVENNESRKIVSTADTNLAVEDVEAAMVEVRAIAESLGGFVETLSSSGTGDAQQARVSLRVPSEQFFRALERIEALGEVHSRNVGSEDVTEQHIDLQARLKNAQREEESLLRVLERAEMVSDVLAIERELFRVRGEIERLEAQLQFLERRVDLATLTVNLFAPEVRPGTPPWASVSVAVPDVSGAVEAVTALVGEEGIIDSASVSTRGGQESADMEFRVFAEDFDRVLGSVEEMGEVLHQDLRRGDLNEGDPRPKEPQSRIRLYLQPPLIEGLPPSAWLTVAVSDVDEAVARVKTVVADLKGVVDESVLSVSEGEERAVLNFRVFAGDFARVLADAENLGKVESEHVSEETLTGDQPGKDPNSRIELMIMEEEADSRLGGILLLSIGGPLVVLALVYGAFRLGGRRGRATAGG